MRERASLRWKRDSDRHLLEQHRVIDLGQVSDRSVREAVATAISGVKFKGGSKLTVGDPSDIRRRYIFNGNSLHLRPSAILLCLTSPGTVPVTGSP